MRTLFQGVDRWNRSFADRVIDKPLMSPVQFGGLLAILIAVVFHQVLLGSNSFFYRDFGLFGYPLANYHKQAFWNGEFPLWNPYSNAGLPFLAQWNTMVCYPLSAIYLLLPLPWSLNVFCLFHLWLAGMGMFVCTVSWTRSALAGYVAGLVFAFCGLTQSALMWPNNIAALAWMPLVVLVVDLGLKHGGRWWVVAVMVASVQFLAGAPEVFLFTWLIIFALWMGDRMIRRSGSEAGQLSWSTSLRRMAVLGLALMCVTAIQWIPLAELLFSSHRDTNYSTDDWAMPVWGVVNFLVPLFHCTRSLAGVYSQDAQQWASSYYLGIGLVWLILVGSKSVWKTPRARIILFLSLFALIMSWGEGTIVYSFARELFPAIGFVRYPIKFIVVVTWGFPLLAGFAIADLLKKKPSSLKAMIWAGLGLAALMVLSVVSAKHFPVSGEDWATTANSGFSRILLLGGMVCAFVVMMSGTRIGWVKWSQSAFIFLVAIDLITHAPNPNPTVSARVMKPRDQTESPRPRLGEGRAMLSPRMYEFLGYAGNPDAQAAVTGHREALYPNWNLLSQTPMINGFFSLYPKQARDVWALFYQSKAPFPAHLADFLGVTDISSDTALFAWEKRPRAFPLVTLGVKPRIVDDAESLSMLLDSSFNPKESVLLTQERHGLDSDQDLGAGTVLTAEWLPERVRIQYEADADTLMVMAQTYSPHWKAHIEGTEIPVWRANHAFQAMLVPAGRHIVELRYRDRGFQLGCWISLLGLSGLVLLWYRGSAAVRTQSSRVPVV